MQKEDFKSASTKERQEISERQDSQIKTANRIKVENLKSNDDYGNKLKKIKKQPWQTKPETQKENGKSDGTNGRRKILTTYINTVNRIKVDRKNIAKATAIREIKGGKKSRKQGQ